MAPAYELIYWPGIPGRGEFVRLALEEAGVEYTDKAVTSPDEAVKDVQAQTSGAGDASNPPAFAPPVFRHDDLYISQTPSILQYIGTRHGLAPEGAGLYHVNALALTILDGLSNEAHDTHHPVSVGLYYEDQKEESRRRAKDYIENRLPKFFEYLERVLQGEKSGNGPWLYGGKLTYADLVLFQVSYPTLFPALLLNMAMFNGEQCVDGLKFAFPNALGRMVKSNKYDSVFKLHGAVKERPNIKKYLASDRRQAFSMGLYRNYPELDPN